MFLGLTRKKKSVIIVGMTNIPLHSVFPSSGSTYCCAHQHLEDVFARHGRLQVVAGNFMKDLVWPKGSGAYVVRMKGTRCHDGVLYIGKCGKVKHTAGGWKVNGGEFKSRVYRWTPYCFQKAGPWADHFEYDPNFTKDPESVDLQGRYKNRVPLSDIQIDCFITTGNEENTSPALIEALLLQNHLAVHHLLPSANQEL